MASRRRALSETDRAAWTVFARGIAPMRRSPIATAADSAAAIAEPPPVPRPTAPVSHTGGTRGSPPMSVGGRPSGIDAATWQRFRGGKLATVRRLDLHGQTTQRAFFALMTFLRTAHADQVRCVEIITGRGSGEGGGAIKREFPLWLNLPDIRPLVLAAAHPHAANPGSVRLLLRRIR